MILPPSGNGKVGRSQGVFYSIILLMDSIKEKHHLFHSFCLRPRLKFDGQNNTEEIVLVLRAHPITQIYWIINGFILAVTLFLLNFLLIKILDSYQIFFFNLFGLVITFSYIWFNFLGWFFNVGIVTNERVIDIDFHNVLYKEVTIAMLGKIEDVTSKAGGFFSAVFDYGNVFVQTAGTEANIEFMQIPKPSQVAKIINQQLSK